MILITNLRPIDESFNHISFLIFVVFIIVLLYFLPSLRNQHAKVRKISDVTKSFGQNVLQNIKYAKNNDKSALSLKLLA